MIINKILADIKKDEETDRFVYPFYEKYCFSNIPATIFSLFDIKTKKTTLPLELYRHTLKAKEPLKVVLFLIDALGFNQWLKYFKGLPFFEILSKKGLVAPLTTVFPSTTAAALTTITTGLTPQEHGLPEWHLYLKEIDQIIESLPFTPLGEKQNNKLLEFGVDPKILFQGETIYQKLKKFGISSFVFVNKALLDFSYCKLICKGSKIAPFVNFSDLVVNLRGSLENVKNKAYFFVYWDALDSIGHKYGPGSEQYSAELSSLSYLLKKELLGKISRKAAEEIVLLVTSDHGQINVDSQKTIYLNKFHRLVKNFQVSENGKPILPTGSARDVFLHVDSNQLEETFDYLSEKLKGKAKILRTSEAVMKSLFGKGKPSKRFLERVGNLLILPYRNNTIWYEHIKGKKFKHLGCHGGLSEEEMVIPFAVVKLVDLM